MSPLPTLLTEIEGRTTALKTAADNLVGWLQGVKADFEQIASDLEARRRAAGEQASLLRNQTAQSQSELAHVEQKVREAYRELERVQREIRQEKESFRKTLDAINAGRP